MNDMNGIFTALLTPFNADYSINDDSLKKLVEFNIESGINGFYVGGSTGEAMLMTQEERKHILKSVKEASGDRVRLIAHVGSTCTDFAVDLALYAKDLGYDAVSAVAPFYYGHTLQAVKQYYYDIAAAADMPLFIYNFPGSNGFGLTADIAAEMFEADNRIAGIKHTSTDLFGLERMITDYPDKVYFNGFDEIYLSGLAAGANAAIGTTVNLYPKTFKKVREYYQNGEMDKARKVQTLVNHRVEEMVKAGIFPAVKYILKKQGLDCGTCRRPFAPLSEDAKRRKRRKQ